MTPLAAIREQIQVILSGIPGIGRVHDCHRMATSMQQLVEKFKDPEGRLHVCMFRRVKMAKRQIVIGGPPDRIHTFLIICIWGLQDEQATGVAFDDQLARIEEEFDSHETLNGACETIHPDWGQAEDEHGVQIDLVEDRMFGPVLCHYGELRLSVQERIAR